MYPIILILLLLVECLLVVSSLQCCRHRVYSEVQAHQRKNQALQVLHKVVEHLKPIRVVAFSYLLELPYLARRKADVLVVQHDFQLLAADAVGLRPRLVIAVEDLSLLDHLLQGVEHERGDVPKNIKQESEKNENDVDVKLR